jgi:hypothetical protein
LLEPLFVQIREHDPRSAIREGLSDSSPDSGGRSRDDDDSIA